jgi:hypothetical protein
MELYQTACHPALSPKTRLWQWLIFQACFLGVFCSATWKTCHQNPPIDWGSGEGDALHVAWLGSFSHRLYFFADFSKNLLDVWPLFFLIPGVFSRRILLRHVENTPPKSAD